MMRSGPEAGPLEDEVRACVDDVRARHGLGRLRVDAALARAARAHGRAMAEHGFFAHESPLPGRATPADRVRAEGAAYEGVGENLALRSEAIATAEGFVDAWMDSPGHRANILSPGWQTTGVGVLAASGGVVYATQLFGVPARLVLDAAELRRAPGPRLYLRGRTSEPAILVVGEEEVRRIEPGPFEIEHPLRPEGIHRVALGFPESSSRYLVARQFDAHPATGRLDEAG